MDHVNIHAAKTNLSRLIARVQAGETVIISKAGRPVAQLAPLADTAKPVIRQLGTMRGHGTVPDDIDKFARDEIEKMFSGSE